MCVLSIIERESLSFSLVLNKIQRIKKEKREKKKKMKDTDETFQNVSTGFIQQQRKLG